MSKYDEGTLLLLKAMLEEHGDEFISHTHIEMSGLSTMWSGSIDICLVTKDGRKFPVGQCLDANNVGRFTVAPGETLDVQIPRELFKTA